MKKNLINSLVVLALSFALVGCKDKAKEADTSEAEEIVQAEATAVKFKADKAASTIEWKGSKPLGTHNGTIALDNGVFTMKDGKLESGTFMIDMKSITVLDIPADDENNAKLQGHLSGADFFDAAQFPMSAFEITGLEEKDGKMMLSGNLTMKDTKNNITIPVTVKQEGDTATITSEPFTIDRTKWNIKYGSKTFFDNLGDKFINDDIELKITVKGTKA